MQTKKNNNGTTRQKTKRTRKTNAPAKLAMPGKIRFGGANIRAVGNKLHLKHREPVAELLGTGSTESVLNLLVNPGDSAFMRWGSLISRNYETYRFKFVKMVWKPSVASTTEGYVRHYFDFDARDATAASSLDAMSAYGAKSGNIWSESHLTANQANLNKLKSRYVRERSNQVTSELGYDRTSDAGVYHLYYNAPGAAPLGILFVEYEVELETPQIDGVPNPVRQEEVKIPTFATGSGVFSPITAVNPDGVTVGIARGINAINGSLTEATVNSISERLLNVTRTGLYKLIMTYPVAWSNNNSAPLQKLLAEMAPFLKDVHNTTSLSINAADVTNPHGTLTFGGDPSQVDQVGSGSLWVQCTKYLNILNPVTLAIRMLTIATGVGNDFIEYNSTAPAGYPNEIAYDMSRVGDTSVPPSLVYPLLFGTAVVTRRAGSFSADYI